MRKLLCSKNKKKMNLITYLKIVFILIHSFESFKSDKFCVLPDRFAQHVKCKEYSCGIKYCSVVKDSCKSFSFWTYLTTTNIISYGKALLRYEKFFKSIKECTFDHYVVSNTEGVCLKKNLCFEKNGNSSKLTNKMIRLCECEGKFRFNCGKGYCATNKHSCHIIFEKVIKKNLFKKIKACK